MIFSYLQVGTSWWRASPGYTGTAVPDAAYASSLSYGAGGIAIRNNASAICYLVGYGTATNAFIEGETTDTPGNGKSMIRLNGGCQDTNNNFVDFSLLDPSAPRNSHSPLQTCGPLDLPPSIYSTSPADGASNVSLASNLSLTFSEAVAPADGWFQIACTLSGIHAAAVNTTDHITFSLDPSRGFCSPATLARSQSTTPRSPSRSIPPRRW